MRMTGEYRIPAPQQTVWDGVNDPAILQQCIPGCESMERVSDTEFAGVVSAKVGPVDARFRGRITLDDLDPPHSCTLTGEGTGGVAGFAKGSARIRLTAAGAATVLAYEVDASVGGKLAQIGQRFIDTTAKKMADDFFAKFSAAIDAEASTAVDAPHAAPSQRIVPPGGEGVGGGTMIGVERNSQDTAASSAATAPVPDREPADYDSVPPSAEDTGLIVETLGETRGFSPMVWIPVLLILLVAIVLFFLNQ